MSPSSLELATRASYPAHLYKNEGPFTREQLGRLARARVAVAGLGAFGMGAVGLAQLGVGSAPGGLLRLADPDVFERDNANRQAAAGGANLGCNKTQIVADQIRGLVPEVNLETFLEGVTADNLAAFLDGVDLVLDIVDFLRPDIKLELHRQARLRGLPVVAGLLVDRGAVGYFFDPANSVTFGEFFGFPEDRRLQATWSLPLSRIVITPQTRAQNLHFFGIVNGLYPIPSNSLSAAATHLLLNHLAVSALLGQPVPSVPRVAYLDPTSWSMGEIDLTPAVMAQRESAWTALASVFDPLMARVCGPLFERICSDLQPCRSILEAGCGTGLLCQILSRPDREVTGIDSNLAMLGPALKRSRESGFRVGEGDVEQLFFDDQSFDGYVSVNVLLENSLARTLREARRVLRPGGLLALSSFSAPPDLTALEPDMQARARAIHQGRRYCCPEEMEQMVLQAGFTDILRRTPGFLEDTFYILARR